PPSKDPPATHWVIYKAILGQSVTERQECIDALLSWSGLERAIPQNRRLSPAELRDLDQRPGHRVGAHSASHLTLTGQPASILHTEVAGSASGLERVLRRRRGAFG